MSTVRNSRTKFSSACARFLACLFCPFLLVLGLAGCEFRPADQMHGVSSPSTGEQMTASEVFKAQWGLIHQMALVYHRAADTHITWMPCNEENSAYDPGENKIYLCTEMSEHPDAALLFAAHEMGHSITTHYFATASEQEADELGQLAMLDAGMADQLVGAALYYADQDIQKHIPGDPHPPNSFRTEEALCMEHGWRESQGITRQVAPGCLELYQGTRLRFAMMFRHAQDLTEDEQMELFLQQLSKLKPASE